MNRPLPPALAALLALVALTGCQAVRDALGSAPKPDASIVGAEVQDLDFESLTLRFDVRVDNPYGVALPLAGVDYALAHDGRTFLSGTGTPDRSVPARGSETVPVTARLTFRDALAALEGVQPGAVFPYRADLGLSVDAPQLGRLRLPLSHEGTLPIPAVPEVSVRDVQIGSLALDRVDAVVTMEVQNPNDFLVRLTRVGYRFALGGQDVARSDVRGGEELAPGARRALTVEAGFSPAKLGLAALGVLQGDSADVGLAGELDLGTPFGDVSAPFDWKGSAPLRRRRP